MLKPLSDNQAVVKSSLTISPEKKEIRNILLRAHQSPKWILTLGGYQMIDAKLFFRTYSYSHIVSIERDPKIWAYQIKEVEDLYYPLTPLKSEFSNFIEHVGMFPPFDLVYLDFNCVLSKKLEGDLTKFFPALKTGSFLGITLVGSHDGVSGIEDTFCFNKVCGKRYDFYKRNRANAVSQTFSALAWKVGRDLKEIKGNRREYQNTGLNKKRGTPMMFLLYKVIK